MKRRNFIETTLTGGAILGSAAGVSITSCADTQTKKIPHQPVRIQEGGKYNILLKGGHVIDPANNINGMMDVAIARREIALVQANIPVEDARMVVDVSGLYVTPGLRLVCC